MKAQVGDRLVRDGSDGGRACEIIDLHHTDGSPPYVVRWLSDGHIALLYPGPYMRLVRAPAPPPDGAGPPAGPAAGRAATTDRPAGGTAKPARRPAAGRRRPGGPFAPRSLTVPWPARSGT
jgi:hypothetical protein